MKRFLYRIVPLWVMDMYITKIKRPPCVMCDEIGELKLEDGRYICSNCAQIVGELSEM